MNWKRVGRLLVCLVLVAALIVNVSPIRAKAIGPTSALVSVGIVIASVLIGLGISVGTEAQADVFDDVVSDAKKFLTLDYNFITDDDKVQIWSTGNPDMPWAVDESLIDALFGWIYDSGVVTYDGFSTTHTCSYWSYSDTVISFTTSIPTTVVAFCEPISGNYGWENPHSLYIWAFASESFYVYWPSGNSSYSTQVAPGLHRARVGGISAADPVRTKGARIIYGSEDSFTSAEILDETFTSLDGLSLSDVAAPGTAIPDGYSVWNSNAMLVQDEDGSSKYIYPVSLGDTYESTREFGQTDVWEGIGSTYSDSSTDTDTGTDTGTSSGTAADVVTGVVSGLQDQTAQIGVWLGELIAGVQAIPQAIADVLTAIFVPSADYVTAKVESLRARFPFISSVISTGESLRDSISGSSGPPAIYVDLGRASSGNYGSQKVLLTDFAWYAEYKPTVDAVLSAALWAFFGWRVFLKLPGIISGESGVVGDISARAETYNKIKAGPPTKK